MHLSLFVTAPTVSELPSGNVFALKAIMATLQFSEGDITPPSTLSRNKQLLNNIVDGMAKYRPSAIYAEIPQSHDTYQHGYRAVTYGALANAVNGVAWWLKERLGESRDFQTLAYIGPNDLAYVIMILGAVKAGFKVSVNYLPSPKPF